MKAGMQIQAVNVALEHHPSENCDTIFGVTVENVALIMFGEIGNRCYAKLTLKMSLSSRLGKSGTDALPNAL